MNHLLLHLFVRDATPAIRGKRIGMVRHLAHVLSVELTGGATPLYLSTVLSSPGPFVYLTENNPLPGIGTEVFKRIVGAPVEEFGQVDDDRIIQLRLGGGRDPVYVALRLFGATGKARILGPDSIIESLDPREAGRPLPRSSKPRRPSLAIVGTEALASGLASAGPTDPAFEESCDRLIPGLTRELLDCFRRPPDHAEPVDAAGLLAWRDDLLAGHCRFHLGTRGRLGAVSPLPDPPSPGLPMRIGPFNRADVACRRAGEYILHTMHDEMISLCAAPLRKYLESRRRLAEELELNLDTARSFEMWRKEANVLAAFQSKIPPGSSGVVLPDPYGVEKEITIRLDPAFSLREQIAKRFKRAAKLERSLEAIEKRLQTVRADIESMEKELAGMAKQSTLAEAVQSVVAAVKRRNLEPRSTAVPKEARETKSYRRFDLNKMWFVLVGRNNRENDEITFRVAAPDDTWLHAHQVPGSHVILKSHGAPGNPPAAIIESAAGVAAYFSKARHASLVPVIYTLRKYVRKFRGARPGQVKCDREKTIMAEPVLPTGDSRDPDQR